MLQSAFALVVASVFASASASALPSIQQRQQGQPIVGVATFNNYTEQKISGGGTVCGNMHISNNVDNVKIHGAAAGDLSPNLSAGLCDGTNPNPNFTGYDMSLCSDLSKAPHPGCSHVNCNTCHSVANFGKYPDDTGKQIGQSIIVQIIDACPAGSALNYCKTGIPLDERCGQGNSLDIDFSGYLGLTGQAYDPNGGQPNLKIHITPIACP